MPNKLSYKSDSDLYPVVAGQKWFKKIPTGAFTDNVKIVATAESGLVIASESGIKLPISNQYLYKHYTRGLTYLERSNNGN